jgi:uroporphyrinogen decarboxylase
MHTDPETWNALMETLTQIVTAYLRAQLHAGAAAVQLFDSWVGDLPAEDYHRHVAPHTERILAGTQGIAPRIVFGVGTEELLPLMASHGAEVVGVDWRVPLDDARRRVGDGVALQGNLDPALCLAPWDVLRDRALDILARGGGRGHVFNLGHGVHPDTDPEALKRLVDLVHAWEPPR